MEADRRPGTPGDLFVVSSWKSIVWQSCSQASHGRSWTSRPSNWRNITPTCASVGRCSGSGYGVGACDA
eukprot:scaffold105659_cov66-Phaeocystis_antarctica.AAC.7